MEKINENAAAISELSFKIGIMFWAVLIFSLGVATQNSLYIDEWSRVARFLSFFMMTYFPGIIYLFFLPTNKVQGKLVEMLNKQSEYYIAKNQDWFDIYRDHLSSTLLIAALTAFVSYNVQLIISTWTPEIVGVIVLVLFFIGVLIYFIPFVRMMGLARQHDCRNIYRLIACLAVGLLDYAIFDYVLKISFLK